jgi:hypothetical protein
VRRLPSDGGRDSTARISPDGRLIAYLHGADARTELRVAPLDGGPSRTLGLVTGRPTWTRAGEILAPDVAGHARRWSLDGSSQPLPGVPESAQLVQLVEGLRGLVYASWIPRPFGGFVLGELRPDGARVLSREFPTPGGAFELSPARDKLYFTAPWADGLEGVAWMPLAGGGGDAWIDWPNSAADFALASDGRTMVLADCRRTSHMTLVPPGEAARPLVRAREWTDYRPRRLGPHKIAFTSRRDKNRNQVWQIDLSDNSERALSPMSCGDPAGSRDGSEVAYVMPGMGLGIISVDKPDARQLTNDKTDGNASFTSDGRIVFLRNTPAGRSAFVIARSGGAVTALPARNLIDIDASPTTPEVALLARSDERRELWLQPLDGKPARAVPLPAGTFFRVRVSPDGKHALLATTTELTEVRLDSGAASVVYRAVGRDEIDDADYAGERSLAVQLWQRDGDLWIAKGNF